MNGHEETFESGEYLHFLNCSDDLMDVNVCRNIINLYILNMYSLLYLNYLSKTAKM